MEDVIKTAQRELGAFLNKLIEIQPDDRADYKEFWLTVADTFDGQAQEIRKGLLNMRVGERMREEEQIKKRLERNKKRRKG